MGLGHEKLDVYRLAIDYVAWVYQTAGGLNGIHRPARDQWLRASQSIPLNIAEGNGKASEMIEGVISRSLGPLLWNVPQFKMFLWSETPLKKQQARSIRLYLIA